MESGEQPSGGPSQAEPRPEERPAPERVPDAPPTAQPDSAEPAGDQDAGNEAGIEEATERPPEFGGEEAVAGEAQDPLEHARQERDFYLSLAQRAQADFDNYRKRAAREAAAAGERAKGALVRELLPVVDNLERALASAREGEGHLAEGVRLVHAELVAALERNGVEQFDPRGDRFDPVVHDALSVRNEDGADAGVVLDVVEKGYKVNGTVLRPARVVVSG